MNRKSQSRFFAYALVGATGTGVQYLLLSVLMLSGTLSTIPASALGAIAGAIVNYTLNYWLVFRSSRTHSVAATRFFTIASLSVGVNSLLMAMLVSNLTMHWLPAQILCSAIVLLMTYTANSIWTFRA